ncbi:hypothetical protein [Paenibacillus antibioticophila]|uniref:hypothetical protein n=1 Tax=Paenibacillus antibioticophila TaxID=1274374 RepID=UPI001651DF49|nr:hypothetical protein [Paenibacillus antibioticophila]
MTNLIKAEIIKNFNPRTRMGCDLSSAALSAPGGDFNPRTRMGCDQSGERLYVIYPDDFNPRTRMGCDHTGIPSVYLPSISIHAPAWGATLPKFGLYAAREISIHAPAWGAT